MLRKECSRWSDNEIAKRCHVSQPFVLKLRASLITVISEANDEDSERTYTTKHGTESLRRQRGSLLARPRLGMGRIAEREPAALADHRPIFCRRITGRLDDRG